MDCTSFLTDSPSSRWREGTRYWQLWAAGVGDSRILPVKWATAARP